LSAKPSRIEELGVTGMSLQIDSDLNRFFKLVYDEGPNHDINYLLDLPPITTTDAQANGNAINGTSPFYQIQAKKTNYSKTEKLWYCGKSVVTSILYGLVEKHEGAVSNPDVFPNSYAAIFRSYVDSLAYKWFEPVVGYQGAANYLSLMNSLEGQAASDSQAMDHDSRNYITSQTLTCDVFNYKYPTP
jgi:hypothetical protein